MHSFPCIVNVILPHPGNFHWYTSVGNTGFVTLNPTYFEDDSPDTLAFADRFLQEACAFFEKQKLLVGVLLSHWNQADGSGSQESGVTSSLFERMRTTQNYCRKLDEMHQLIYLTAHEHRNLVVGYHRGGSGRTTAPAAPNHGSSSTTSVEDDEVCIADRCRLRGNPFACEMGLLTSDEHHSQAQTHHDQSFRRGLGRKNDPSGGDPLTNFGFLVGGFGMNEDDKLSQYGFVGFDTRFGYLELYHFDIALQTQGPLQNDYDNFNRFLDCSGRDWRGCIGEDFVKVWKRKKLVAVGSSEEAAKKLVAVLGSSEEAVTSEEVWKRKKLVAVLGSSEEAATSEEGGEILM